MPYTSNPRAPHVRMQAVQLVKKGWGIRKVARHFGFAHSTILRWVAKGLDSRKNTIPTESSRPHHHPRELSPDVIRSIVDQRLQHRRWAEVIHAELLRKGIIVSLSSIKRTLFDLDLK